MGDELQTDATQSDASSVVQTQSTEGAQAGSSPATQAEPGKDATTTMADIVSQVADSSTAREDAKSGSGTPSVPDGSATKQPSVKEEPTGQTGAQASEDPDSRLPFAQHPRWKEVYSERCEYKRKLDEAAAREQANKPLIDSQMAAMQFYQQNGISVPQLREGLEIMALINRDPGEAFKRLAPLYERLAALNGRAVSLDQDLQEALRVGKLDEEWARQIQAGRAQQAFQKQRQQYTEAQQAEEARRQNEQAIAQWDMDMRQRDLAFKPSTEGKRGLYELTASFLTQAWQTSPPRNAFEAVQLAQKAYKDAREFVGTMTPPPPKVGGKTLPPNGSSASAATSPKSLEELVLGVADGSIKVEH